MAGGIAGFVATSMATLMIGTSTPVAEAEFTPIPPAPPVLTNTAPVEASAATDHGSVALIDLFGDGEGGTDRDTSDSDAGVSSKLHPTGIDISSHQHGPQGSIDIGQTVSGGQSFAFVKATEGTHYINPQFRSDTIKFIEEDVPVGFYHYARPAASSGVEQARLFVRVTGIDDGVKAFPPVLDIETDGGLSASELTEWVGEFVDEIKRLTDRETMIYTYPNFWKEKMGNTTEFNHLPLWIASYAPSLKADAIPGGWEHWDFWQYTDSGRIPGYSGKVDVNVFNGTESEMEDLYIGKTVDHGEDIDPDSTGIIEARSVTSNGNPPANPSVFPEGNLKAGAIQLGRAIADRFPEIKSIGGYRPSDPFPDHPSGRALDIMIPNYSSSSGKALGDEIVQYILDNQSSFGLDYMIWEQKTIDTNGNKSMMEDRGDDTQNHYDHIHVLTTDTSEFTEDPGFTPLAPRLVSSGSDSESGRDSAPKTVTKTVKANTPEVTKTVTVTPSRTDDGQTSSSSRSSSRDSEGSDTPPRRTVPLSEAFL